jgi:methylthioribose-1-phosphate isomerase
VTAIVAAMGDADGRTIASALQADADARAADAEADHAAIARTLAQILPRPEGRPLHVLVHGDPGALTHGILGPLTGALLARVQDGGEVHAWVAESRPGMEGARLASWELAMADLPHTILADGAVGVLLAQEPIDAVLLLGDWIAADGSVAALVGSRMIAAMAAMTGTDGDEAAEQRRVPVLVCAPISTFDPDTPDATALPRDSRLARDLRLHTTGTRLERATCWNPGLDVIPAAWIDGYVTEEGVVAPDGEALAAALTRREARRPSPERVASEALDAQGATVAASEALDAQGAALITPVAVATTDRTGDPTDAVGEPTAVTSVAAAPTPAAATTVRDA